MPPVVQPPPIACLRSFCVHGPSIHWQSASAATGRPAPRIIGPIAPDHVDRPPDPSCAPPSCDGSGGSCTLAGSAMRDDGPASPTCTIDPTPVIPFGSRMHDGRNRQRAAGHHPRLFECRTAYAAFHLYPGRHGRLPESIRLTARFGVNANCGGPGFDLGMRPDGRRNDRAGVPCAATGASCPRSPPAVSRGWHPCVRTSRAWEPAGRSPMHEHLGAQRAAAASMRETREQNGRDQPCPPFQTLRWGMRLSSTLAWTSGPRKRASKRYVGGCVSRPLAYFAGPPYRPMTQPRSHRPRVTGALVNHHLQSLAPVIDARVGQVPVLLDGCCMRVLGGCHLAASQRRLDVLLGRVGTRLPGLAAVPCNGFTHLAGPGPGPR